MNEKITTVRRPLEPRPRAIVVGASSGIGAALARRLALSGYYVAAVARREEQLDELCANVTQQLPAGQAQVIQPYRHDVTDFEQVPELFQQIVREIGGLDLIIYSAAVQFPTDLREYDFAKDADMINTNFLGAVAWLNEAAKRFQQVGRGQIVAVSSVSGDRGRVAGPAYGASKAGLNTYVEALRNRLSRHGITVTTIKPGFVNTRLLKNAAKTFWVISPDEAAEQIHHAIDRRQQTVYIPKRWQYVMLIIRHIPSFIFRRLSF